MASKQIISYGALVERSLNGTSGWAPIPECKGVAVPEVEQEFPEVTNFDSPDGYREYIRGLKDGGEIDVPCGYTSAGMALMLSDQAAADAIYYRVTLTKAPNQATSGDVFAYRGFPTPKLQPGDVGDPIEMVVTIRVTGNFTLDCRRMIEFESGGKRYELAFTHASAQKRYEIQYKETIAKALGSLGDFSAVKFGRIFQAVVSPKLNEAETDALLDALGTKEAVRLVGAAAQEDFPQDEAASPNPEAPQLTGPTSVN